MLVKSIGEEDNVAAFYNNKTGERTDGYVVSANERTPEWYASNTWKTPR